MPRLTRRDVLQNALQALPASILLRGFSGSHLLPMSVEKAFANLDLLGGGWNLYEVCGQSVFHIYGITGGLATRIMSWLIRCRGTKWEAIPIEFNAIEIAATNLDEEGLEQYVTDKIQDAIKNGKPVEFSYRTGSLPMPNETTA
jgi:hypothetical protein